MTCAKKVVVCWLFTPTGEVYRGENWCQHPQRTCPRDPGEGYEKCWSVCGQVAHAEVDALMKAGDRARGATAIVQHKRVCDHCLAALAAAGVTTVIPTERV